MKILELTNFSAGSCGVFTRVLNESLELKKLGYEVRIFSSNFTKGIRELANENDLIEGIKIKRFKAIKIGGESFMFWFNKQATKEALKFNPDIIIAHSYRHPHTKKAVKLTEKLRKINPNVKCFLVTHAPFIENDLTRSFVQKIVVKLYDKFIGPKLLKKFDKIITITKWEIPYLEDLGITKDKTIYIPNGLPKEFFSFKKQNKEEDKILFLGRISKIKNLEVLIEAISLIEDKKIKLEIVGPAEESYKNELIKLIKNKNVEKRIIFTNPIYDLKSKIKKIDSAKIFILPSKREAMPQSLIEAMAREKIVVSSDNPGSKELIEIGKTGYLFKNGNANDLAGRINFVLDEKNRLINKDISKNAKKFVEQFKWDRLIKKINFLF